jgi:pimeloyl-ACP methyl ester carboxylesterase
VLVTERQVELGGVRLSIAEAGAGQRPLLLVHGFTGAKEDFTPWLGRLADAGWHAVAPDLRGHGGSSKPAAEASYSFEILAGDVLRLSRALDWDRFVLLGHSMGGMIAQFIALAEPGRLDGLVLMDTSSGALDSLDPDLVQTAVSIVRTQGMDGLADIMAEHDRPLETPAHRRLIAELPGYEDFEDRKFRATSPALYAAMAPAFATAADRLDRLRGLPESLPVLVLVGEQDQPFIGPSERMAAAVGRGTLAIIPDAGHCPQFENGDAWWSALQGFLSGIEARTAAGSRADLCAWLTGCGRTGGEFLLDHRHQVGMQAQPAQEVVRESEPAVRLLDDGLRHPECLSQRAVAQVGRRKVVHRQSRRTLERPGAGRKPRRGRCRPADG